MNSKWIKFTTQLITIILFASLIAGFFPSLVQRAYAAPGDKSILSFSFASPPASGVISGNNITVTVPFGIDVTTLVPTIVHNGASVSPNSGIAQNFTNPVTYTVTAADLTTQSYIVTVIIPITVTANAGQSKVFSSADPVFTYTSSNPVTFTGALGRVPGESVGSYAIQQGTLAAVGSNYSIIFVSDSFLITPKPVTVTPTAGQNKVFGSSDPVFTYASSDPAAIFTGALSRAAGENTGAYAFNLGTLSAGSNYTLSLVAENFSITPKPVTITPTATQGKIFGSPDPIYTYTSSDPAATFSGTLSRAVGENVGIYAFSLGTLSAGGNYTLSLVPENFSITPEPVLVTPTAGQSKVFGSPDPVFTYASSEPAAIFSGVLSRASGESAGAYSFTLGTLNAGSNYSLNLASQNFTITPKPVTITPTAGQSKVFGVPDPFFTYTSSDPAATFTGILSRASGESAGTYAYTLGTLSAGSNYVLGIAFETFTILPSPATDITGFSFTIPAAVGTISGTNIAVTVPFGTDVTALVATFATAGISVKVGSTIQISGMTPNNFTSPVTYTVTAPDSSTKNYVVTVTISPSPAKDITDFRFGALSAVGVINGSNIVVMVPLGTDVSALVADFTTSGASVKIGSATQASGTTVNNFMSPVTYTVIAADSSTKDYTINVTIAPSQEKDITSFSFSNLAVVGTINGNDIVIVVPFGTAVSGLAADFTTSGASVRVGFTPQVSGSTVNDFTNPLTYTVTAADGSTKNYTVTVTVAPNPLNKDITAFGFAGLAVKGTISGTNITVTVPYGTDVSTLVADFTTTGASVKVGGMEQVSGITANDFSNINGSPVVYTVVAENGSTKDYMVTVNTAAMPSKDITSFGFTDPAVVGVIKGANIEVKVPFGTNLSALVANFTTTGTTVKVGSQEQVSGATVNSFTKPLTYVVIAANKSTKAYKVTVTVVAKDITAFLFKDPSAVGVVDGTNILITVPQGTNVRKLVAYFKTTGVSVKVNSKQQVSGVTPNDFTKPVTYVVIASDKSTKAYTVKVTIARKIVTEKFRSNGLRDGWVLESSEYSNVGGSSETNTTIRLGDDSADRQYRALLHFPTYYLPDNAVVTRALLMIQQRDVVGTDPFATHGPVSVDISKGLFLNINLTTYVPLPFQLFETSADMYSAGVIQNNPDAGWYWTLLDDKALPYINLIGITQVRLGFQLDDNDDLGDDYVEFYSGDNIPLNNRPYLLVDYYVP